MDFTIKYGVKPNTVFLCENNTSLVCKEDIFGMRIMRSKDHSVSVALMEA